MATKNGTTNGTTINRIAELLPPSKKVQITAPNMQTAEFHIRGLAPYVQHKFGAKAREMMRAKQASGSTTKKGTKRDAKDFDLAFREATHRSTEGWCGIPAPAFRNAMIDACRFAGFKMTFARGSVFALADGIDAEDQTPLVRIDGEPTKIESMVRNETGVVDIRARPMWPIGWTAKVRIQFDADQFSIEDVANLLHRAGLQVGIGEGRPMSRDGAGCGWGIFEVYNKEVVDGK